MKRAAIIGRTGHNFETSVRGMRRCWSRLEPTHPASTRPTVDPRAITHFINMSPPVTGTTPRSELGEMRGQVGPRKIRPSSFVSGRRERA